MKRISTLVCVAIIMVACGRKDSNVGEIPREFTDSYTYGIVEGKAPEGGYKIYLDASGSMPGYFTDGLTDYIKIISGIQGGNENTKVYFWGNATLEITNLNSTITNGNYKAKASLFQEIFSVMAQEVRKEKALTFLVTDGIVSNASSVTNRRTGYTIADLPLLPEKIKNAMGDSLAVGIFRFEIPFNGAYWDIDNKSIPLKKITRPIFVFAIGYPTAVSDFRNSLGKKETENFTNLNPKQLYLGILKEKKDNNPFRDVAGSFVADSTEIQLSAGSDSFEIAVDIPEWIPKLGIDPAKGNLSIKDSDNKVLNVTKSFRDGVLTVSTPEDCVINIGNYSVNYSLFYRPSNIWEKYACGDDRVISSDTLCDRTFGLIEIIKGFELATGQPDTLFKSSFEFVKQQ